MENNDINKKEFGQPQDVKVDKDGLTRRQFLGYALGGTGAVMASLIATPLVVSAFDPINRGGGETFTKTDWKVSDFNDKLPTHVTFNQHIDDGWNSQDKPNDVFVILYQNKLMIMSHTCTHLGCHVNGSIQNDKSVAPQYNNGQSWFNCPCHGSNYNIYGVPTDSSPAPNPLAIYDYKVVDGYIWVGNPKSRTKQNWDENPNPTVV